MQPFSPFLIIVFLGLGLALGVFAVVRQPGSPFAQANNNTAQVLEPLRLNDTAKLKLYNN